MRWLIHLLTSFKGRIPRKSWWAGMAIIWVVGLAGTLVINPSALDFDAAPELKPTFGLLLWSFLLLIPSVAITWKRLNDRDHPPLVGYVWAGVAATATFAPYFGVFDDPANMLLWEWPPLAFMGLFGLWVFIDNGFLKGTSGPNRYGPDPLDPGGGQAPGGAVSGASPRQGRSRGTMARNLIVGTLALITGLYLVLPGLSIDSTVKWVLGKIHADDLAWLEEQQIVSRHLKQLDKQPVMEEIDMAANKQGWEAYEAGVAAAGQKEEHMEAVTQFTRAIEEYGEEYKASARIFMRRGISYRELGKFTEALNDYSTAIRLEPEIPRLYSGRADIYSRLERYDEALKDYSDAIRLSPTNAYYHLEYGDTLKASNRNREALQSYENSLKAANKHYDELVRINQNMLDLTDREREIFLNWARKRRDRDLGTAHTSRGIALKNLGRPDEALAAFDEAIRWRPDHGFAYTNRGWFHEQQGRLDEARADYEKAQALGKDDDWLKRALERVNSKRQ